MVSPLKKAAFIDAFAKSANMTNEEARIALEALSDTVTQLLQSGQAVSIPNLLTLEPKEWASRKVHNPVTREITIAPARTVARAKIAPRLKAALNQD